MNFQPCGACAAPDTVHEDGQGSETATCEACGARYEIEPDADFDGESYRDCSTVGRRIVEEGS